MFKRISCFFILAILMVFSISQYFPGRSAADTVPTGAIGSGSTPVPSCGAGDLPNWDWGAALKQAGDTSFDYNNSHYIVGMTTGSGVNRQSESPAIFFVIDNNNLQLDMQTLNQTFEQNSPDANQTEPVVDTTNGSDIGATYYISDHSADHGQSDANEADTATIGPNVFQPLMDLGPATGFICIQTAHGVNYTSAFSAAGYGTFGAVGSHGTGNGQSCKLTDLACWITKGFDSVTADLANFGEAILGAFASLFEPDSTEISNDFLNLQSSLQTHLGFLYYPVTFFQDLITAFQGTDGSCGASDCTISFGNFFNHPFSINFAQANAVSPPMWNLFTGLARAILIVGLLFAIKHEYERTIDK